MENSNIEWTDHTFNPWIGCTKVSPGCDHCYAEARMDKRLHVVGWGPGQPRKMTSNANWREPIKWNAQAEREGRRFRVFCASLADVFDNEAPTEWRADLFRLIQATPHLDWLLLTKRIGNVTAMLDEVRWAARGPGPVDMEHLMWVEAWQDGRPPSNVWLGATIVNQAEADRDIPKLLAVPAAKRFLSMEPLLGPVDLGVCDCDNGSVPGPHNVGGVTCRKCDGAGGRKGVDWVIVGGESGPNARPMHPDWARSLRDQCTAAGVAFFFKQWGEWAPVAESPVHPEATRIPGNLCRVTLDGTTTDHYVAISQNGGRERYEIRRVGKKAAGRALDGRTWDESPA